MPARIDPVRPVPAWTPASPPLLVTVRDVAERHPDPVGPAGLGR